MSYSDHYIALAVVMMICIGLGIALDRAYLASKPEPKKVPEKVPWAWCNIKTNKVHGHKLQDRDVFELTYEDKTYRATGRIFIADMEWRDRGGLPPSDEARKFFTAAVTLWRDALCDDGRALWDD